MRVGTEVQYTIKLMVNNKLCLVNVSAIIVKETWSGFVVVQDNYGLHEMPKSQLIPINDPNSLIKEIL